MLERITFGITSFERPRLLEQLVASIRRRYPQAKILVADNGRQKASLPADVRVLNLAFDCGLSRARNALVDNLETEFLLLLEEDFLFTDETRVEPFVEILDSDDEIGMIGGAMRGSTGRLGLYCLDIDIFRNVMYVQDATRRMRVTPYGTSYRVCDIAWNFGLFRREFLALNRWDDRLKVGEHAAYFHQAKLRGQWRVAATPAVVIYHVPDQRTEHYRKHRHRAKDFLHQYLAWNGLRDYRRVPPLSYQDDQFGKPNVVVLGVGHSGTTVFTRMLNAAGWDLPGADKRFAECVWMRDFNLQLMHQGHFDARRAMQRLSGMPQPWAVKDPRFVFTLHFWKPLFAEMERPPTLVRISRNPDDLKRSYLRRGFRGNIHDAIDQRLRLCERQYEAWPWPRVTIQYEQLGLAARLFSQTGSPVDDVPPIWPPGPETLGVIHHNHDDRLQAMAGSSHGPTSADKRSQAVSPGWQAAFSVDENIEGTEHQMVDEVVRGDAGSLSPAWKNAFSQDEIIEGMEHRSLDGNVEDQSGALRSGWQQAVPQDEIIEGMEHRSLDGNVEDQSGALRPGWQQTVPQDEIIEGMEHRSLDGTIDVQVSTDGQRMGNSSAPARPTAGAPGKSGAASFVPGWKSIVPEPAADDPQ